MMEDEMYIDLANVTLQDCLDLFCSKGMETIIADGRIIKFAKRNA